MSDEKYLKKKYYLSMGKELDLDNPKTYNEKLQWLKLNDRKNIYTVMADKYEAKQFISDIVGEEYVIPTIGIYDKFEDINFDELPDQFVMKCTHDSGGIVICKNKSELDIDKVRKRINKNLRRKYYYSGREWAYKNIRPRIIIEKYMGDDLTDYRFYCFNGEVKYIYRYINESKSDNSKPEPTHCNIYDKDWVLQDFHQAYLPSTKKYLPPKNLKKMISFSEKLSKGCPFIRVDFYEIDGALYLGELTFYPGGGFSKFHPDKWDKKLGDLLDLSLVK